MSTPDPDEGDAPKLTPEASAVISRARRSFLLSIGLLVVGFIIIGVALVYRSGRTPEAAPATPARPTLLPP